MRSPPRDGDERLAAGARTAFAARRLRITTRLLHSEEWVSMRAFFDRLWNGYAAGGVAVVGGAGRVDAPAVSGVGRRLAAGGWWAVVVASVALVAAVALSSAVGDGGSERAAAGSSAAVASLGLPAAAQRAIGAAQPGYRVDRRGEALVASGGGVSSTFGAGGVRLTVPGGVVRLRLAGVGRGAAVADVHGAVAPVAAGAVVRYRRGGLVEWYRNGPLDRKSVV